MTGVQTCALPISVITARNTGFFTVNMKALHEMNQLLLSLIMFIGGGPGSNAGGIRVMVFLILILTTIANLKGQEDVVVHYRSIQDKVIMAIFSVAWSFRFTTGLIISCPIDFSFSSMS